MKDAWIRHALSLAVQPAELYAGSRKIIRAQILEFDDDLDITLADAGYSKAKMSQLRRNYLHQESVDAARGLWDEYRSKPKYRSVAISCFGRLVKDHGGPRGSKMGSCLLSVTITMLNRGEYSVELFYRTTEFLKKFPADLIFVKEDILSQFNFEGMTCRGWTCFFSNITIHPAYFVTILPHLENPVAELKAIREKDKYFSDWVIKWTSRYLIPEHGRGIQKFTQAVRVKMDADKRILGKTRDRLIKYVRANHPGYARSRYDEALQDLEE